MCGEKHCSEEASYGFAGKVAHRQWCRFCGASSEGQDGGAEILPRAQGTAYPDEGLEPVGRGPFPNWSTEEPHLRNLSREDTYPDLQKGTIYANSLGTR